MSLPEQCAILFFFYISYQIIEHKRKTKKHDPLINILVKVEVAMLSYSYILSLKQVVV